MKLSKLLIVTILVLFFANASYSQDIEFPRKGNMSLVFAYTPFQTNLSNGYTYDSTNVTSVGLSYMTSDLTSVDLNVGLVSTKNLTSIGLALGGKYYLPIVYHVSPYIGAEVGLRSVTRENSYSINQYWLGARLGFEYFVTSGFSLGANYSLNYTSSGAPSGTGGTRTNSIATGLASFTAQFYIR